MSTSTVNRNQYYPVKSLWRKKKELLEHRATTIPGIDRSPSHLSMGCRLKRTLSIARDLLKPEAYNMQDIKASKEQQKYYYDPQCTKELLPLRPGDHVRMKPEIGSKEWKGVTIVQQHASPRSNVVDIGGRRIRQNRLALRTDPSRSHTGFWKRQTRSASRLGFVSYLSKFLP